MRRSADRVQSISALLDCRRATERAQTGRVPSILTSIHCQSEYRRARGGAGARFSCVDEPPLTGSPDPERVALRQVGERLVRAANDPGLRWRTKSAALILSESATRSWRRPIVISFRRRDCQRSCVRAAVDGHYPRATFRALSRYSASRPGGLRRRLTVRESADSKGNSDVLALQAQRSCAIPSTGSAS